MFDIVTSENEIKKCQHIFAENIKEKLKEQGDFTIGYPGGDKNSHFYYNSEIWFSTSQAKNSKKFLNQFGLSKNLKKKGSNNITVQINIPINGIDKKVAGIYALNKKNNELYIFHRGKVGGGRKGIGKKAFLNWSQSNLTNVYNLNFLDQAILIGKLSDKNLTSKLSKFIKKVAKFKEVVELDDVCDAIFLSDDELKERISATDLKKSHDKNTTTFNRNIYISEYVKRRAKGICQLCNNPAPFIGRDGKPFLESHHIEWLSNGGDDSTQNTVAICPNCHRKMHNICLAKDVKKLKAAVSIS
jgi:5-methylcytosine-specific restriction protein A